MSNYKASAHKTINRMQKQAIEWEKTFVNRISDKRLISKYIRNSNNSITTTKSK